MIIPQHHGKMIVRSDYTVAQNYGGSYWASMFSRSNRDQHSVLIEDSSTGDGSRHDGYSQGLSRLGVT